MFMKACFYRLQHQHTFKADLVLQSDFTVQHWLNLKLGKWLFRSFDKGKWFCT